MKTKIEHKYNIGDSHFDFEVNGNQSVREFKIIRLILDNDGISYVVSRPSDQSFSRTTEFKEKNICPTIEDWIKRKTQEYQDKITEIAKK